jgi:hypothetical protein
MQFTISRFYPSGKSERAFFMQAALDFDQLTEQRPAIEILTLPIDNGMSGAGAVPSFNQPRTSSLFAWCF